MLPSFSSQINYKNDCGKLLIGVNNFVESYCSILTNFLCKSVKHYQQIDSNAVVPVSSPQNTWKQTAAKILVVSSLLIPVIPLLMLAAKWGLRKINHLQVQPPAYQNPANHCYLEEAREIRNFRENPAYVSPKDNKKMALHCRTDLPADLIINSLFKDEAPAEINSQELLPQLDHPAKQEKTQFQLDLGNIANLMNKQFYSLPWQKYLKDLHSLDKSVKAKQDKILEEGFNGFLCVQGIESNKGGIRNLLNVLIEGVARTPYAGGLIEGDAAYCAGPHGPFYMILDSSNRKMIWDEDAQIAYLVPEQRHRKFLEEALTVAEQRGYITEEEKLKALKKVITYDEFIALPYLQRHSETLLKRWLV